jgi:hypothetical protein
MPRSEWSTDSFCDSDGSEKDPFADPPTSNFIVPSPVTLSDAEEDASPSLYRKEMARVFIEKKWRERNAVANQMMKMDGG